MKTTKVHLFIPIQQPSFSTNAVSTGFQTDDICKGPKIKINTLLNNASRTTKSLQSQGDHEPRVKSGRE